MAGFEDGEVIRQRMQNVSMSKEQLPADSQHGNARLISITTGTEFCLKGPR